MNRIAAMISALVLATGTAVAIATPAHATSCAASMPYGIGYTVYADAPDVIDVHGHAACDAITDIELTVWIRRDGTIVASDTYSRDNGTWTNVQAHANNLTGNQVWCGKASVFWNGGTHTTGWQCESNAW